MISHKYILKIASRTPSQPLKDKCYCYIVNSYTSETQCINNPLPNKSFCNVHINYENMARIVGIEKINDLPRCETCFKYFNAKGTICPHCLSIKGSICKWPIIKKTEISRCSISVFKDVKTTCHNHKDYDNYSIYDTMICWGCHKILPSILFTTGLRTCNKCSSRDKKKIIPLEYRCQYIIHITGLRCINRKRIGDFCRKHQWKGKVMYDNKNGIIHCANYVRGCKIILSDNYYQRMCQACLKRFRNYDNNLYKLKHEAIKIENEILIKENKSKCYYCKIILDLDEFKNYRGEIVTTKCTYCRARTNAYEKNRTPRVEKSRYYDYVKKIKRFNYATELTYELAHQYFKSECFYCGDKPDGINGIDRIYNVLRAYIVDNMVPSCRKCNFMKRDSDIEDFIKICTHIAVYVGKFTPNNNNEKFEYDYSLFYTANRKYEDYKRDASRRKIPFKLTKEEFNEICKNNCKYCGLDKSESKSGLDRVDSNNVYILDNVVSACSTCNIMKNDYDIDVFYDKCTKVAKRFWNCTIDDEVQKCTSRFCIIMENLKTSNYPLPYEVNDEILIDVLEDELDDDIVDDNELDEESLRNISRTIDNTPTFTLANDHHYKLDYDTKDQLLTRIYDTIASQKKQKYLHEPQYYNNLMYSDSLQNIKNIKFILANTKETRDIWSYFHFMKNKTINWYSNSLEILIKEETSNKYIGFVCITFDLPYEKINKLFDWSPGLFLSNQSLVGVVTTHMPLGNLSKNFNRDKTAIYELLFTKEFAKFIYNIRHIPMIAMGVVYKQTYNSKYENYLGNIPMYIIGNIKHHHNANKSYLIKNNIYIPKNTGMIYNFNTFNTVHECAHGNPYKGKPYNLWYSEIFPNAKQILSKHHDPIKWTDKYMNDNQIYFNDLSEIKTILNKWFNSNQLHRKTSLPNKSKISKISKKITKDQEKQIHPPKTLLNTTSTSKKSQHNRNKRRYTKSTKNKSV